MSFIKFDNVDILSTTTYITRFVKHESATPRELITLDLARDDGAILINDRRGVKKITIQGILIASSESALDTAIDTFKEVLSRQQKYLDISFEGSTRRYIATCTAHEFDRDFFHLLFVPYTAEFTVLSGVGTEYNETTLIDNVDLTYSSGYCPFTATFAGTAKPAPVFKITFSSNDANATGVMLENVTTGEKLIYTQLAGIAQNDYFEVDYVNKQVRYNGVVKNYIGTFPSLIVGSNSLRWKVGEIPDQVASVLYANITQTGPQVYGNNWSSQAFTIPYKDNSYKKLKLFLYKDGTPPNALTVEIQSDTAGKPSGTAVATGTIAVASIPTGIANSALVGVVFSSQFTLNPNTRYHIVTKTTAGDASKLFGTPWLVLGTNSSFNYYKGGVLTSSNAGSTWTDEGSKHIGFSLFYAGQDAGSVSAKNTVKYYKRYI